MADFVQTMKDWRRMCRTMETEHPDDVCNHCPLLDISPDMRGCDAIYADEFADNVNWRRLEEIVDIWTQANPEPVYPTWYEFMRENKIIPDVLEDCGDYYKTIGKWLVKATIKHDIAQKLGLHPKEG